MKNSSIKKFFLLPMLGLLLFSCSNQELLVDDGTDTVFPSENSFMSVRLVTAGTVGTRAVPAEEYEDGAENENYVKNVLLFFFDEHGNAAGVFKNNGEKVSYYDWQVDNDTKILPGDENSKIEKSLTKILTFRVDVGTTQPKRVLAVLNPTDEVNKLKVKATPSLQDFLNIVEDYEDYKDGVKKRAPKNVDNIGKDGYGGFVMSNSVYVDESGEPVNMTKCDGKFYTSADTAINHPVTIYVERVLARIDLSIDIDSKIDDPKIEGGYIYVTGKLLPDEVATQDDDATSVDDNIYVRFLGWNVFDTPKKSRLIKEIDAENWTNERLFGYGGSMRWNSSDYYRSFWAINPLDMEDDDYRNGPFMNGTADADDSEFNDDKWTVNHNPMPAPGEKETDYFQENASPSENHTTTPTIPSKVVIAAQLVNSDGEPLEIAKFGDATYTIEGLKNLFANGLNMWKFTNEYTAGEDEEAEPAYVHITPDDLVFERNDETIYVSVVLKKTEDGTVGIWYEKVGEKEFVQIDNPEETIYEAYGKDNIKVWTNGYAYYYFTIRHLGEKETDPGYYGVVRNHIYDAHVTSVAGIGVPVFNERDPVRPDPTEQDWYLSAKVKILSWRIVRQDYELNW